MSIQDFFSPITHERFPLASDYQDFQLGKTIQIYTEEGNFPTLAQNEIAVAIFGVIDDRASLGNDGCAYAPDFFRKELYKLSVHDEKINIVDLGNVLPGKTIESTYFAVKEIVSHLIKLNILPIIIGGGQDLTFAQYQAYESLEQLVDLVCLDAKLDMDRDEILHSQNYMYHIIKHEPNYLFNYCNIGHQRYLVNPEILNITKNLFFDAHRLGDAKAHIEACEPFIRNADMISVDMNVIRAADAPAHALVSPNGFLGEELCKLCRYAGMSDKLSSIGFYELNPSYDTKHRQSAQLLAQMVWFVIEGYTHRRKEFPSLAKNDFYIYKTLIQEQSSEIIFIKSKLSDRWWLQVPYPNAHFSNERFHWIPCSYDDYLQASEGQLPDIWWRTYQKLR